MLKLPEQVFVDILNYELQMPSNTVFIRDQNFKFNNTGDFNIIIGMVDGQFISTESYLKEDKTQKPVQIQEVQETISRENIQIDFISADQTALQRRWEVVAALKSFYSQQQQAVNSFKIFNIPNSFINTSEAEGGNTLNRFSLVVGCFVWYRKIKILVEPAGDYYDDFTARVDDEQTIGTPTPFVEFEINSEGIT